jgi:CCR4-NOT transcription complex subunit 3
MVSLTFPLLFVCAAEIDRTLKRIDEGIQSFDDVYDLVLKADTQLLKEKYEADLKKEIKKLQRYRDQIKGWVAGTEVKQKAPLVEARKSIERKMEVFKVVERETKTKAYSKEGLARDTQLSPEEKRKARTKEWLQDTINRLSDQVDEMEAETEQLEERAAGAGGLKKREEETLEHLDKVSRSHRWHVDRMEALIRMIDNDATDPDAVDALKDDLDYYVDSAREDEAFEPDFEVFAAFDLTKAGPADGSDSDDDSDSSDGEGSGNGPASASASSGGGTSAKSGAVTPLPPVVSASSASGGASVSAAATHATAAKASSSASTAASASTSAGAGTPAAAAKAAPPAVGAVAAVAAAHTPSAAAAAAAASKGAKPVPAVAAATAAPAAATAAAVAASAASKVVGAVTPKPALAAAQAGRPTAASIVAASSAVAAGVSTSAAPSMLDSAVSAAPKSSLAAIVKGKAATPAPGPGAVATPSAPQQSFASAVAASAGGAVIPAPAPAAATAAGFEGSSAGGMDGPLSAISVLGDAAAGLGALSGGPSSLASALGPMAAVAAGSGLAATPVAAATASAAQPLSGLSLQESFAAALASAQMPVPVPPVMENPNTPQSLATQRVNAHIVASSLAHLPESVDVEKPRSYIPRNPFATHVSFPTHPAPAFDTGAAAVAFDKLGDDTLFFIFYYQQGSYQQYLAAKTLKRHNWMFHKKYCTWFQRGADNAAAGATATLPKGDGEHGTYVYFDYETGWVQRIKRDFTFQYAYKEDELL